MAAIVTKPIRIGLVGAGTVGGGVYEIIQKLVSKSCVITKICVKDIDKPRSFELGQDTKLVTDVDSILSDASIDIVVEVMGGTTLAKQVVVEALKSGKSVVTANKALIADHLDDLHHLAKTSQGYFSYEAAVCGGIPIIQTLHGAYTGDTIYEVMGICNGTTNYMLGKMEAGADYDKALAEAQALGFAEADPTADVEGHDVRAKIAIMAKLAFGTTISPVDSIPCRGISSVTSVDFEYAKLLGCTIKLVGTAARMSRYEEHDGSLSVYVTPTVVPLTHLLASARGCGNAVAISSVNMGIASYTGAGAGRFPTANSIVSDILRIVAKLAVKDPFPNCTQLEVDHDYSSHFYIRIPFRDGLGIIRKIGELSEKNGISIHAILQNPIVDHMEADFVITTEVCKLSQVVALCSDMEKEDFVRAIPLYMPLLLKLSN